MTALRVVLLDDATARRFEPFALTRPHGEQRAGALLIRERWERVFGSPVAATCAAPHLATYDEFDAPPAATGVLPAGTILVNSRCAPALDAERPRLAPGASLQCDGTTAAVALARDLRVDDVADGTTSLETFATGPAHQVTGWWIEHAWDCIRLLPEMLASDVRVLADAIPDEPPIQATVLGEHRLAVARGAYVEPHVVADTTEGDVIVMTGARIGAFTRLAGPCVIGAHARVAGGRISCCAIGEHARACGEMSVVIVAGHANKSHDGFIGHSVIGRWANLGAGTITSNLKNNYGKVRLTDSAGEHDTGMQYLGSLIGDHAKLAISTRLTTGTIVGGGANVFGDRSPEKYVPPFAWGDRPPFGRYELEKFLDVAALVMRRRDVAMSDGIRAVLGAAWHATR